MEQIDTWDDYFIEGTNVLKNNFNIDNNEELEQKEKEISLKKITYLELFPIEGKFDAIHLRAIHKFIFDEIYPFAGEYRTCTLAKTTRNFYDPDIIEDELDKTLKTLSEEVKSITDKRKYAYVLAKAYYDLMTVHPFREGNGRSVREFLKEFVDYYGNVLPYRIDYSKMNEELFLQAVEYRYLYPSMLDTEFYNALVPIEKENTL